MLETNVFQVIIVLCWYEEDYMFEFIKLSLYALGSAGMIYASYHDFRHAQNGQKDKCIFFQSKKTSAFVLVCFICLFLSNLTELFSV